MYYYVLIYLYRVYLYKYLPIFTFDTVHRLCRDLHSCVCIHYVHTCGLVQIWSSPKPHHLEFSVSWFSLPCEAAISSCEKATDRPWPVALEFRGPAPGLLMFVGGANKARMEQHPNKPGLVAGFGGLGTARGTES